MLETNNSQSVDLVAVDRDGRSILLGQVKTHPVAEQDAAQQLISNLQALEEPVPYALLVDPDQIRFYRWDGEALSAPVCTLPTSDVLRHYDPELSQRRVFDEYLTTLVEAWLRDLAYHWKSTRPPAADGLDRAGFLRRLEGGGTLSGVRLSGGHLRRD
jgi:hypothetical protein